MFGDALGSASELQPDGGMMSRMLHAGLRSGDYHTQ